MELQIAAVSHVCRKVFTGVFATLNHRCMSEIDMLSHMSHATYRVKLGSIYLSNSLHAGCDMRQCDTFRETELNRN